MRVIPGFSDYLATEDGRIFSRKTNRYLRPFLRSKNRKMSYFSVNLVYGKKGSKSLFKTVSVHECVLSAFKGMRRDGKHGAHLDGNPHNNSVDNLEWVTPKENASHKFTHGTIAHGEKNGNSKLTKKDVFFIRENTGALTYAEMARTLSVSEFAVSQVAKGKTWKRYGAVDHEKLAIAGVPGARRRS